MLEVYHFLCLIAGRKKVFFGVFFGKSFRIKLLLKMRNFLAPAISERRGKYEQNES